MIVLIVSVFINHPNESESDYLKHKIMRKINISISIFLSRR